MISSEIDQNKNFMSNFMPLLHVFLRKMPRNPKFDQYNEVKVVPSLGKSTDRAQNLVSSGGGQHITLYQILGHSFHPFSRKGPETSNLASFTKSRWYQNEENHLTVTKI